jgi:hypothetical protein
MTNVHGHSILEAAITTATALPSAPDDDSRHPMRTVISVFPEAIAGNHLIARLSSSSYGLWMVIVITQT